ncbi:MAG: hypothetical protein WBL85_02875 [Sedimentisphaerales bacterium]
MSSLSKVFAFMLFCTCILLCDARAEKLCGDVNDANKTIIDVIGGEYRITNNVWRGTSEQCLSVDTNSTFFSVIHTTHDSNMVAAYPSIVRGRHFGGENTKNSGLPIQISNIATAPVTWSVDVNHAKGVWNTAFEAWFSTKGGTIPEGGAELMVWLNKKGSIIMPAGGEKKATITVAGTQWNVYFDSQQRRWRYIAYERAKPSVVASFDLKDFINDAVSRGYLESSWYLDSMEAGFEIIQDGQGLTNRSFSASVTGRDANQTPAK